MSCYCYSFLTPKTPNCKTPAPEQQCWIPRPPVLMKTRPPRQASSCPVRNVSSLPPSSLSLISSQVLLTPSPYYLHHIHFFPSSLPALLQQLLTGLPTFLFSARLQVLCPEDRSVAPRVKSNWWLSLALGIKSMLFDITYKIFTSQLLCVLLCSLPCTLHQLLCTSLSSPSFSHPAPVLSSSSVLLTLHSACSFNPCYPEEPPRALGFLCRVLPVLCPQEPCAHLHFLCCLGCVH